MSQKQMTLHEAIRTVLLEMPNQSGTPEEICATIVTRGMYKQKAGGNPFADQVFLRARNYHHLFEVVDRETIRLKEDPSVPRKDPVERPAYRGERGGPCPKCGADTVGRMSRTTQELYFGCTAPKRGATGGCNFKGCRSH